MIAPVRAVAGGLVAARASMSPEQRWTAGVALVVAVCVLLFGHPLTPVHLAGGAPGGPRPALATDRRTAAPPMSTAAPEGFAASDDADRSTAGSPAETAASAEPQAAASTMRVVALVEPDGGSGRGDARAAEAFLSRSSLEVRVVTMDRTTTELCADASTADVVVAGLGLPDDLRRCLGAQRVAVLSFDEREEASLSTRRRAALALDDVMAGTPAAARPGPVGVVAAASLRPVVERAIERWRAEGIDVPVAAFVPDDATVAPTADVRRFVAAGVRTALHVAPSRLVSAWSVQHSVLDPRVRYLVTDAFDAVWNESYAPVLDGAVTVTSLRVPWQIREAGETPEQAACRTVWEESVTPGVLVPGAETIRVFAWCQHVALLERASDVDAIRTMSHASPLTFTLAPSRDRGWGPAADVLLRWSASCRCWESVRAADDDR